ncbi:transcriptional elongation regulator [Naematelia encephala]|uniref:Peptidyl-prolyl cis-trans isomerase n=1 Tax=Naematelia encephala TaxID=71784 RepID=A0A1Y2BC07_9TREE|nr:transcriptional elongation regulator [Naematelia encephala]
MSSSGWEVRFSSTRNLPYFFNGSTSTSQWDAPSELSPEQIAKLPGAEKYLSQGAAGTGAVGGAGGKQGQARASHILAKHTGSRRPSSWKQEKITRSKEEARKQIQAHIDHLSTLTESEKNREFAKIASVDSDCSSAKKGGDLGWFGPGQMQKSFEEATFALQPGQMSGLVESDSGVHVIYRTG